jgi:hypothetical protein
MLVDFHHLKAMSSASFSHRFDLVFTVPMFCFLVRLSIQLQAIMFRNLFFYVFSVFHSFFIFQPHVAFKLCL